MYANYKHLLAHHPEIVIYFGFWLITCCCFGYCSWGGGCDRALVMLDMTYYKS